MLSIAAKMRTLVNELDSAIHLCDDIIGTLSDCRIKDLTDRVGIFARQMPDYKILTQEKKELLDLIRKVCTAEIPTKSARAILVRARDELKVTRKLINL